MLMIFSYISVCIFTRTDDKNWDNNKWKVLRNKVYIWCGLITFLSIVTIAVLAICEKIHIQPLPKYTYWLEVCALVPFGISWLVKGGFILTDDGEPSTIEKATNLVTKGKWIKPSTNATKKLQK
jgi:hypothetical protein